MKQNQRLETGYCHTKIGLDAQGKVEKQDVARPIGGNRCFGVVVHEVVGLAQSTQGKHEIDAAQETRIVMDGREVVCKVVAALVYGRVLALDSFLVRYRRSTANKAV